MDFYLASGFSNRYNLRELAEKLIAKGHTVQSSWIYLEERADRNEASIWDVFASEIARQNKIDLDKFLLLKHCTILGLLSHDPKDKVIELSFFRRGNQQNHANSSLIEDLILALQTFQMPNL